MIDKPPSSPPLMAAVNSLYQTRVSQVQPAPGTFVKILSFDARRTYVRFTSSAGGSTAAMILPGPLPATVAGNASQPNPQEWKWRDAPSIVTGEFFVNNIGINTITIIEVFYVGG